MEKNNSRIITDYELDEQNSTPSWGVSISHSVQISPGVNLPSHLSGIGGSFPKIKGGQGVNLATYM
jgi:hypothetical protein